MIKQQATMSPRQLKTPRSITQLQDNTVIGMMDAGYFVPKNSLLNWIKNILSLEISYIEDLGTGAVYCQLLDAAFNQCVHMHQINWNAKFQYEFITNLKLFQKILRELGISKAIDIQKLSKCKHQDNLQIVQWLKKYIELSGNLNLNYDAQKRRNNQKLKSIVEMKKSFVCCSPRSQKQKENINNLTDRVVDTPKNSYFQSSNLQKITKLCPESKKSFQN